MIVPTTPPAPSQTSPFPTVPPAAPPTIAAAPSLIRVGRIAQPELILCLTCDGSPDNRAWYQRIIAEHSDLRRAYVLHEQHVVKVGSVRPMSERILDFSEGRLEVLLGWARDIGLVDDATLLVKNTEDGHPAQPGTGDAVSLALSRYTTTLRQLAPKNPIASYGLMKMDQNFTGKVWLRSGQVDVVRADAMAAPVLRMDDVYVTELYLSARSNAPGGSVSGNRQAAWLTAALARTLFYADGRERAAIAMPWYHAPGNEINGKPLSTADVGVIVDAVWDMAPCSLLLNAHVGPASGGNSGDDILTQIRRWREVLK